MLLMLAGVMMIDRDENWGSDDGHTGDDDHGVGGDDRDRGPKPIPARLYRCEF